MKYAIKAVWRPEAGPLLNQSPAYWDGGAGKWARTPVGFPKEMVEKRMAGGLNTACWTFTVVPLLPESRLV